MSEIIRGYQPEQKESNDAWQLPSEIRSEMLGQIQNTIADSPEMLGSMDMESFEKKWLNRGQEIYIQSMSESPAELDEFGLEEVLGETLLVLRDEMKQQLDI